MSESTNATYAAAGVDIEAGDEAVELLKPHAQRTSRPEVLGGVGGFAGLFSLKLDRWKEPVLASSTDGVGTKIAVAQTLDKHDTVGIDLVAMVVDDLVVTGAEPLFLQDYIAVGKVVPKRIEALVSGIAEGCVRAGCALLGGETAEHPGLMGEHDYDLSATGVGVVEASDVLGPERVRPGDVVIAMGSSGLHSNGYSLARRVLLEIARMPLEGHVEEFGRTLGEELLEPTRIYAKDCLALAAEAEVRTFAHITGGGLEANLARVMPHGLVARLARDTWTAGAGVRAHRAARQGRARRDGEDVQHGRRHGRDHRRRGRRPRARGADSAARAGVGAGRGPRGRGQRRATGRAVRRPPAVLSGAARRRPGGDPAVRHPAG